MKKTKEGAPKVRATRFFKLKDRPGRLFKIVKLKELFGFLPEVLVIEKLKGSNNKIRVLAVLTPDEIAKEEREISKVNKKKKKTTG